jgi:hypothetical protein
LLQARQNDLVAVIDVGPAKTRDIARASIMPLLRRSHRAHQNKRNDEKKSGHILRLPGHDISALMSYSNGRNSEVVMPGLVPGIHVFTAYPGKKDVDGRDKPAMTEKTMIYKTEITSLRPCWIA